MSSVGQALKAAVPRSYTLKKFGGNTCMLACDNHLQCFPGFCIISL